MKSQWDFGELFPADARKAQRKVLSVSELTGRIRRLLEDQVGEVWVTGEITNLRVQSSGHVYFTLKDAGSQVNCVLFRGETGVDRSLVQDGRKVTLQGELTVYEPRGQYQLRVTSIELEGVGALQAAFEKLKQKLKAEGLFAQERKRTLPEYPSCIGLVTSPTGAAIRDVLHVIERRDPSLRIILVPCRVQGDGAAQELAAAIRLLNEFADRCGAKGQGIDLILLTRGGGSLEDLWAFNEEVVARAIFESVLPVVSAVGHEVDFTISDFVADFRAATPTAAAEIITEGVYTSRTFVTDARSKINQLAFQQLEDKALVFGNLHRRLGRLHPRRRFNDWLQQLDDLQSSLVRCGRQGYARHRQSWHGLAERLARVRPAVVLKQRRDLLSDRFRRLRDGLMRQLDRCERQAADLQTRLRLLGPEQVLNRGYSITMDAATGKVLRAAADANAGQVLKTRLKIGEITSRVEKD